MIRVRVFRNSAPHAPRWRVGHLPVRQTLVWIGPLFVLVQVKP